MCKNITQTTVQAQLSALIVVPYIFVTWVIAINIYGCEFLNNRDDIWTILSCIAIFLTIIPHELIHALGWMCAAGKKKDEMLIKLNLPLGASIRFLGEMKVKHFVTGTILPFITTSLIPVVAGLLFGNFYLLLYGTILSLGCGSDIALVLMTRKYLDKICYDPGVTGIVIKGVEA